MDVGHFRGTGGVVHQMDLPLPEVYADQVERGDLVRVNADGSPYSEDEPKPVRSRARAKKADEGA